MQLEIKSYYRDQLRGAREAAFKDAEAFEEIIFVIERIGVYLTRNVKALGGYAEVIADLAASSPLAEQIPDLHPNSHTTFQSLYSLVREARNDALHQGAFARHLTNHAVELALILEDALMTDAITTREFMVRDPVCAYWWQPISSIRREMLLNSFSFLPVAIPGGSPPSWKLISDYSVARYLRGVDSSQRKIRLATPLGEAVTSGDLKLTDVEKCRPDDLVTDSLNKSNGGPVLVIGNNDDLRGIITPFDML